MKSKIFILFCLLMGISFTSCNNNKTTSNKEELDTVWNEKVQDSFYGLKLGSTASIEQITKVLEEHGFYFIREYSSNELLHFKYQQSKYFSFGGLSWEILDIRRTNNTLTSICFMNTHLDKAESLEHYNNVKNAVEAKYRPTVIIPKDTTTYAQTVYFGRNAGATITCFRYETVSKEIMIGTTLSYWTQKYIKPANDEL